MSIPRLIYAPCVWFLRQHEGVPRKLSITLGRKIVILHAHLEEECLGVQAIYSRTFLKGCPELMSFDVPVDLFLCCMDAGKIKGIEARFDQPDPRLVFIGQADQEVSELSLVEQYLYANADETRGRKLETVELPDNLDEAPGRDFGSYSMLANDLEEGCYILETWGSGTKIEAYVSDHPKDGLLGWLSFALFTRNGRIRTGFYAGVS